MANRRCISPFWPIRHFVNALIPLSLKTKRWLGSIGVCRRSDGLDWHGCSCLLHGKCSSNPCTQPETKKKGCSICRDKRVEPFTTRIAHVTFFICVSVG